MRTLTLFLLFSALIIDEWGLMRWVRKSYLYEMKWKYGASPPPSLTFTFSGIFHYHKSYGRNFQSQHQRRYWGHGPLGLHSRHLFNLGSGPKTTGCIILTTPPEVHSSTPPSSKQKPSSKEGSNSKTITSRSTNPTPMSSQTTATRTISCDTEIQKTSPNYKIYKLISKSLPSLLMPLSLKPPTHQRPPQKTRMLSLTFPTIFPRTVAELLGIKLQKLRDTTIPITF